MICSFGFVLLFLMQILFVLNLNVFVIVCFILLDNLFIVVDRFICGFLLVGFGLLSWLSRSNELSFFDFLFECWIVALILF